jgi:hypothetical protein
MQLQRRYQNQFVFVFNPLSQITCLQGLFHQYYASDKMTYTHGTAFEHAALGRVTAQLSDNMSTLSSLSSLAQESQ